MPPATDGLDGSEDNPLRCAVQPWTETSQRDSVELLSWLPDPDEAQAWLRGADGMVGWGTAARLAPIGGDRFSQAQTWWDELSRCAVVHNPTAVRRGGPVALVRMAYEDASEASVVRVPRMLLSQRRGRRWLTTAGRATDVHRERAPRRAPVAAPTTLRYHPGTITPSAHRAAVSAAVARIRSGTLQKVVLGRDLMVESATMLDQRWILSRLATLFPTCWIFAVDGLLGASPELLLRVTRDRFAMLVLAGTSWPAESPASASPDALITSAKNRAEHAFAVHSAVEILGPLSSRLHVAATPSVLRLPNVSHLSTHIRGRLRSPAPGPLTLLGRLHPTAAVCGTPRDAAQQAIRDLERMERGGYLGPVGWIDAHGDAEFAVALRCAQVSESSAQLFAGGGIVADSTPEQEEAEVEAKLDAFRSALHSQLS